MTDIEFTYHNERATYSEALGNCLATGGRLAVLNTRERHDAVVQYLLNLDENTRKQIQSGIDEQVK